MQPKRCTCPGFGSIEVSRRVMLLTDRRDLRTFWDALRIAIGDPLGWILVGTYMVWTSTRTLTETGCRYRKDMSEEKFLATVAHPSLLWS